METVNIAVTWEGQTVSKQVEVIESFEHAGRGWVVHATPLPQWPWKSNKYTVSDYKTGQRLLLCGNKKEAKALAIEKIDGVIQKIGINRFEETIDILPTINK